MTIDVEQAFMYCNFGKIFAVVVLEYSIINLITWFTIVKTIYTLGVIAFFFAVVLFFWLTP